MQPRLAIPFSGAIDVASVSSATVFLVALGNTLTGAGAGKVVGISQIVWDPIGHVLYAESDELLDQHARWLLIVTNGVRDDAGDPVEVGDFATFRHDLNFGQAKDHALKAYRKALIDALDASGLDQEAVVAASVFSTQECDGRPGFATRPPRSPGLTHGLSPEHGDRHRLQPPAHHRRAAVDDGGAGGRAQRRPRRGRGRRVRSVPRGQLRDGRPLHPAVGTRTGSPTVQSVETVHFNLFLPSSPKPAAGWPVAIFGHGFGDNKNNSPFVVASILASRGIATIAINVVGHGFGALGTLTVGAPRRTAVTSRSARGAAASTRAATGRSTRPRASTRRRRARSSAVATACGRP
jgi:hypothetical protein